MHKVSSKAESEAPAVARWAALVGYAKTNVLRRHLKVSAVGESLVSRVINSHIIIIIMHSFER